MKISEIITVLEGFAPPVLAEEWDNVGLMVGSDRVECTGVMLALDLTHDVIAQAKRDNCNLIVTHHPFIFHAIKRIDFSEANGEAIRELIKNDITVYSMHTNLDKTSGGLNDAIASMLGGKNIELDGVGVMFEIEPKRLADFAKSVACKLSDKSVRIVGNPDKTVSRVYAVSGSGASEYARAKECADVMLTGDFKHHNYIDAVNDGFALVEYTHFASEIIAQDILARVLSGTGIKTIKAIQHSPFRLLEEI
ncbi:MAG: Nif3-like dinuclear metal center hexameric protein [Clostridia bacterium]|nr:Nif3-like dinuclear metal center hexameric protein [Clostridia bacterium]